MSPENSLNPDQLLIQTPIEVVIFPFVTAEMKYNRWTRHLCESPSVHLSHIVIQSGN